IFKPSTIISHHHHTTHTPTHTHTRAQTHTARHTHTLLTFCFFADSASFPVCCPMGNTPAETSRPPSSTNGTHPNEREEGRERERKGERGRERGREGERGRE